MDVIRNRMDFVYFFEVKDGNPNGDPDAGNMPRQDSETADGLVTDVCLKHKIRKYVSMARQGQPGYDLYIQRNISLNDQDRRVCEKAGLKVDGLDEDKLKKLLGKAQKANHDFNRVLREIACATFFDVRTFGAVMTTFAKATIGFQQIRGPVQMGLARSVDPISPMDLCISRGAITRNDDMARKDNEFGRKPIVPYGLYRVEGHISAGLAQQLQGPGRTGGFSEEDLALFWEALMYMFEEDASAARSQVNPRLLVIFHHDTMTGDRQAFKLFECVRVYRRPDVEFPRRFGDYIVDIDEENMPGSVKIEVRE